MTTKNSINWVNHFMIDDEWMDGWMFWKFDFPFFLFVCLFDQKFFGNFVFFNHLKFLLTLRIMSAKLIWWLLLLLIKDYGKFSGKKKQQNLIGLIWMIDKNGKHIHTGLSQIWLLFDILFLYVCLIQIFKKISKRQHQTKDNHKHTHTCQERWWWWWKNN